MLLGVVVVVVVVVLGLVLEDDDDGEVAVVDDVRIDDDADATFVVVDALVVVRSGVTHTSHIINYNGCSSYSLRQNSSILLELMLLICDSIY